LISFLLLFLFFPAYWQVGPAEPPLSLANCAGIRFYFQKRMALFKIRGDFRSAKQS